MWSIPAQVWSSPICGLFDSVLTDISLLMQWWLPAIADCSPLAIRCSSYHALVFVSHPIHTSSQPIMIITYSCVLCLCTQLCSGCILILLVKLSQGVINGSLLANTKLLQIGPARLCSKSLELFFSFFILKFVLWFQKNNNIAISYSIKFVILSLFQNKWRNDDCSCTQYRIFNIAS